MNRFFTRFFAIIIVLELLISPLTSPAASAISFAEGALATISPEYGTYAVLKTLGVNITSLKESVLTSNALKSKAQAPTVSVSFSSDNPLPGESIIAAAMPMYFSNDPKSLYYTWYLKHKKCRKADKDDENLNNGYNSECDLNKDDKVDLEDYKIEAARITANAGFDWQNAIQTGAYDNAKDDFDGFGQSISNEGYDAPYGGADQLNKNNECAFKNTKTGTTFPVNCVHLFPNAPKENTSDPFFEREEERFWHTDPNSSDTSGSGQTDAMTVAGVGKAEFSWNYQTGDEIGVVVEGTSMEPTKANDSSYKAMWAFSKNQCNLGTKININNGYADYAAVEKEQAPTSSVDPTTGNAIVTEITKAVSGATTGTTDPNNLDSENKKTTYHKIITTTEAITGNVTRTDSTIEIFETIYMPGTADERADIKKTITTTGIQTINNAVDGDGNPLPPYDVTLPPQTTTETHLGVVKNVYNEDISINTLNDCLYENFLTPPGQVNAKQVLKPTLSFSPEAPLSDPSGTNSNTLTVSSSIVNSDNPDFLHYTWSVAKSYTTAETELWDPVLKSELVGSGPLTGTGVKEMKFKLQFPEPAPKFLKVTLDVTEKISADASQGGHAFIIIPITSSTDRINVYSSSLTSDKLSLGAARCDQGKALSSCPVVKNEIVGLKISSRELTNFSWLVNDEPLSYTECFFEGCKLDEQTDVMFFPVLKNRDETYKVTLNATKKATGEKVSIIRSFQVVDPSVKIVAADSTVSPVLLGSYADLDGKLWPDYSETALQAVPGSVIKLKALFNNPFIDQGSIVWTLDGQEVAPAADGTLTFSADKALGETYLIHTEGLYVQSNPFKKMLNKYWGVGLNQFYESQVSSDVELTMVAPSTVSQETVSKNDLPRKFLASIAAGFPGYVLFLFKLVLTTALLLFTTGILFSFFPKPNND